MITETIKTILNSILADEKIGTILTTETRNQLQIWVNDLVSYLEYLEKMGYLKIEWLTEIGSQIIKILNENITLKI
ncbi:hypothetical protein [Methanosphaera sp.]|uniref:hypothetical protein n=1 Tax=Methanosphaera sp. TaxID=2666342 RepID=UPI002E75D3D9|nr:hypothetical protein [Methanosphaera sp.]MEE1118125.1 hypothetical protein [Methanosphaera sp.]